MKNRTAKRLQTHLWIVVLVAVFSGLFFFGLPPIYRLFSSDSINLNHAGDMIFRLSLSLGYVALLLLLFTLLISVWNLLTNKKPLSLQYDLRRDVGIWAGVAAIFHSVIELFVHFRDKPNSFLYYFILVIIYLTHGK